MEEQAFENKLAAREAAMASELSFVRSRAQTDREALQRRLTHADREVANCHAQIETMRSKLEAVGAAKDAELTFVRREQSARVAELEKQLRVLREAASTSQRTLEARSAAHDAELRFVIDRHRRDAADVAETERKLDDALDHNKALLAVQKALRRDLQSANDRLAKKTNDLKKLKAPKAVSPPKTEDLADFLRSKGLERHLDAFLAQDLDTVDDLKLLNDEDWKLLGLPLGPTRKLQVTIEQQFAADGPVVEAPAAAQAQDDDHIDDSPAKAAAAIKKKKKKFKKPFVKNETAPSAD